MTNPESEKALADVAAANVTPAVNAALEATAVHPQQPLPPHEQVTIAPPDSSLELVGGPRPNLPGYEMLGILERGGMGVIHKARQIGINRIVALKMIRSGECADPQELVRFQVEAQAVAQLDHPNIVRIYDFGDWRPSETAPPLPYFSMEYVDGGSLDKKLTAGPLSPRQAAELAELLARAVHFVHSRGIVHRDLKPANVLLTSDGLPKIADFGLAKKLDGDLGLTMTKTVMGTASYMAPEQAAGKTKEVGAAADIYALGAILYEMLSGQPPFKADTRELTIYQVMTDDPPPPSRHGHDVPGELEAICLKCLEKEPAQRFATAAGLADDLKRWLAGEPISIAVTTEEDRHARWARRAGYEILELLGCGRTGYVYQARQLSLNRLVTLKLLPVHSNADPEERAALKSEAEAVARLHHPNIAQIYDLGEHQGQPYLVFEYVEGVGLSEKIGDVPMPPREVAELIESLARTMQYAHQRGIVHCGLTPSCILMTADGSPRVTRFGVARILGQFSEREDEENTARQASLYSAPEQIDGLAHPIAPTVDVYGLGAIMYLLLTGRPPFNAATQDETRAQILGVTPTDPRSIHSDVPDDLARICLKCLEKDPTHRYASMDALVKDLQRFGSSSSSKSDLNLMARLSRTAVPGYVISGELGQTPHFTVYKALHVSNQRIVALKVVPTEGSDAAVLRPTLEKAMRMFHPNIVQVFDVGSHGGFTYLAEELFTGGNLRKQTSRAMEPMKAAPIVETLARAVEFAHQNGVVHGALRPSNILMTADGGLKISEFGLPATTPTYLAPEQIEGKAPTPAADVYALGAVLYQLLTGQPPFRGDTAADVRQQIAKSEPLLPSRLQPNVPLILENICLRCLRKNPAERFPSARALADELHRAAAGGPWRQLWKRLRGWVGLK